MKPYERNNKGNIWAMYKDNNKNWTSIIHLHYVQQRKGNQLLNLEHYWWSWI